MKNFYFEKLVYSIFYGNLFFQEFLDSERTKNIDKAEIAFKVRYTLKELIFFDKIIIVPMFLKPNGLELGNIKGLLHLGPNLMNLSHIAT